jgi:hypothetical protein
MDSENFREEEKRAGGRLAEIGADAYRLADEFPAIEQMTDFNDMMRLMNKLSYRLIHGVDRDA